VGCDKNIAELFNPNDCNCVAFSNRNKKNIQGSEKKLA